MSLYKEAMKAKPWQVITLPVLLFITVSALAVRVQNGQPTSVTMWVAGVMLWPCVYYAFNAYMAWRYPE